MSSVEEFLKIFGNAHEFENDMLLSRNICWLYTKESGDNMMYVMKKAQFITLNTAVFIDDSYLNDIIHDPTTRVIMVYKKSDIDNYDELKKSMSESGKYLICASCDDAETYDDYLKFVDHMWGMRKTNPDYL